jgi:heme A synthase
VNASIGVFLVIVVVVLWRTGRNLFGKQSVSGRKLTTRILSSAGLGVLLGATVVFGANPEATLLEGVLPGLILGGALGWLGVRLTEFEKNPSGMLAFYTPNRYVSGVVLLAFVGRFVIRFAALVPMLNAATTRTALAGEASASQSFQLVSDPLSAGAYFILVGYYLAYAGVLLWRLRDSRTPMSEGS